MTVVQFLINIWGCTKIFPSGAVQKSDKKTFVEPKRVSENNNLGTSLGHLTHYAPAVSRGFPKFSKIGKVVISYPMCNKNT